MKIAWGLCLLVALPAVLQAQGKLAIDRSRLCSWNDDIPIPEVLYGFPPDKNATDSVGKIMAHTGLRINFELVAANVPNATATMQGTRRLILYSQLFMQDIAKKTSTDWAAMSILAHELGHHLNQHTLGSGGGRDEQELAADKFSGDILFKMGATLDQARAAMASRPETKSPNYPPKSVRLVAIGNGWINAQEIAGKSTTQTEAVARQNQLERERKQKEEADRQARLAQEALQAQERERQAARQRAADEKAEREERARQREEREEREERARQREEREERARQREEARRGCYDNFGRRWCTLPAGTPLGSVCFCFGIPGSGITGTP